MKVITPSRWLTQRWEKPTAKGRRYYLAYLQQTLWGEWTLTTVWGRCGTRLGHQQERVFGSYETALEALQQLDKRRCQRGYVAVTVVT